jgi:hypothetical protein
MTINDLMTFILKLRCVASWGEEPCTLVSMSTEEDIGASNFISIWIERVWVAWTTNEREEVFPRDIESSCDVILFECSGYEIIRNSVCPNTIYVAISLPVVDEKLLLPVTIQINEFG